MKRISQHRKIFNIQAEATTNQHRIMSEVRAVILPTELLPFIERYEEAGWGRDTFLWQWAWRLLTAKDPGFTFSTVPDVHRRNAALVKITYLLAVTMTDDAADERQDGILVDHLCAIAHGWVSQTPISAEHAPSVALLRDLFKFAENQLVHVGSDTLPRAMLSFDIKQIFNAFSHAWFVNSHSEAINFSEALTYGGHNMMMCAFADIDLCFSHQIDATEIPVLRLAALAAQDMARVGNWVTTWKRELPVGDLTSGVAALLIRDTDLTAADIKRAAQMGNLEPIFAQAETINAEQTLLDLWSKRHLDLCALATQVGSVDLAAYIAGLESIMEHHFASVGAK